MDDISQFLSDCVNGLQLKNYGLRSRALSLEEDYEFINLDILDSFGYICINLNSGILTLILNYEILEQVKQNIIIPDDVKIVHIINRKYDSELQDFNLITSDSTIILYHKDSLFLKDFKSYIKYLKYSDIQKNKNLKIDVLDTLFLDSISLLGKERKLLKSLENRINKINNLILLIDEYNLNELSDGCDFDAMLGFIENDIKNYIIKIEKIKNIYDIDFVYLKVLLHQNNNYMKYIFENEITKNGKSLLTSGFEYVILSMYAKYGLNYEDDIKTFISKVNNIEEKLNSLSSNVYVELVI